MINIAMKKVIITDYFSGAITIVSISDELIKEFNGDIESLLLENSRAYIASSCDWFDAPLDEFGNIQVQHELLNERKS